MTKDENQEVNLEETQNDESQDNESVDESQQSSEEESHDENKDTEESETSEQDTDWEAEAKKWKSIAKRKEKKDEKAQTQEKKEQSPESNDAVLARLENRGVMDADDQAYVLRVAKIEEKSPIEALNDPVVKDRLERNKKEREQRESSPRPNNRTGSKENEVDRWVRKYKRDGSLPDNNPALTSEILERLKTE